MILILKFILKIILLNFIIFFIWSIVPSSLTKLTQGQNSFMTSAYKGLNGPSPSFAYECVYRTWSVSQKFDDT